MVNACISLHSDAIDCETAHLMQRRQSRVQGAMIAVTARTVARAAMMSTQPHTHQLRRCGPLRSPGERQRITERTRETSDFGTQGPQLRENADAEPWASSWTGS
jgi:hypothetical protein